MPAYALFIREGAVFDADEMAKYAQANRAAPPHPGLKPLALYGKMETLEGDAPDGIVLLEFPDMASAKAWYDGAAYQAAAVHRRRGADYRAILFEGL
jgi:uncharacterized protein (DUF1330 family)